MDINLSRLLEDTLRDEIDRLEARAAAAAAGESEAIRIDLEDEEGRGYVGRFTGKLLGEADLRGISVYLLADERVIVHDQENSGYWKIDDLAELRGLSPPPPQSRLRHPLARERQAPTAARLRDEDRGPPMVRRQREPRCDRRAPTRRSLRRLLRPLPRAARRDRRRGARRRRSRSGSHRRARLRRLAAARARGRRRRRRRLAGRPAATSRYRLTSALRQTLGAAVRWRYIARNPAVEAGRNPQPRAEELHPFTGEQIDALAAEIGPVYGPLVVFAAETGLRTNEWVALERRDVDRAGPRRRRAAPLRRRRR